MRFGKLELLMCRLKTLLLFFFFNYIEVNFFVGGLIISANFQDSNWVDSNGHK